MRLSTYARSLWLARFLIITGFAALGTPMPASAATLSVCASGCAFNDLQQALDAAQPGDTLLLRAGETFVGHFRLPVKHNPSGAFIVIRSDASDGALPPAGTRLVPHGYPGGNTDVASLARLVGRGGIWKTTPVLETDPGASHYRLQFLDIDGVAQEGWETLVQLGHSSWVQSTWAAVPSSITMDRVFIHGHATKGQKRCVALDGRNFEVLNSYIVGCASVDFDSQAIAAFNGPGPFRIINNYLEATGENVMFGGADPKIDGLVPSDIEIRRNHFFKPVAWRDPILRTPAAPWGSAAGGGALPAGMHYFTVVAVLQSASEAAFSAASPERAVSLDSHGSAVTLGWDPVPGAERYRVYRGTSSGAQNRYLETSGAATSFTYSGADEVWQTPPAYGSRWNVKNLLELKNAQRVLIDGNVFEQNWAASQTGYAIVLTPRNEDGGSPWSVVQDVTFSNNVLRHAAGGINILGEDDVRWSQRTGRITIRNNLVYDLSSAWGGQSHFLLMTRSPHDITVDHNTIFHQGMVVIVDTGEVPGFRFTNNLAPHNTYGIFGSGAGMGSGAIAAYFPDAVVRRNALGGGPAALYPADNFFPDMPLFTSQFVNPAANDYRLVSGSTFRGAGTDGQDLGVDFAALNSVVQGVVTGGGAGPGGGSPGGGSGDGGGSGGGGSGGSGVSSPFGGAPVALPGILQAEDFDQGSNGIAYYDTTSGNAGGQYRNTDVDIEATGDSGGGHNIGWLAPGEWLKYTVDVASAGTYTIDVRVAAPGAGGTFHIEVDGVDRTGPMVVPATGGWQSWTTLTKTGVPLGAGRQVWALVVDGAGPANVVGNVNSIRVSASSGGGGGTASTPFSGAPMPLPGIIQAEDFDNGSSGIAYYDTTGGNAGGQHRNTDVDIEGTADTGGGYNVGWLAPGEWLKYTVDVASAGTYTVDVRVAATAPGGTFHIEVDGVDRTGPMVIPATGGWQSWTTVSKAGVVLGVGRQVWTLVIDSRGPTDVVGNINYIRVSPTAGGGGGGGGSAPSTPFAGTPVSLPGTIQAEDFDNGGSGTAYSDTTSGNAGGQYRGTDVDIEGTLDSGGGYNVGWIMPGEWLAYTAHVSTAGAYDVEVRVASAGAGGSFHIEVNGIDITGRMAIPDTGGWQGWTTIRRAGVTLQAGAQVWRLVVDSPGAGSGDVGNINFIRVVSAAGAGAGTGGGAGTDIVLYASDVSAAAGNWSRASSWSGAGGEKMQSADWGWSATAQPQAAPGDYFEAQFTPQANVPYRIWLRLRAEHDSKFNDSVWVQFSGAVDSQGSPAWRIGTGSALLVNLEGCADCGVSGWGWRNGAWWLEQNTVVQFGSTARQSIRVQTREDGVEVDQIILSPATYFHGSPGAPANDATIVPKP